MANDQFAASENGVGKTTLLKLLAKALQPSYGEVKWSENADLGYMAQDVSDEFDTQLNLREWTERFAQEGDDDQVIRGILGRLLFSNDEIGKQVKVCSGGEKNRLVFGRLMLGRHNVLLMDEPTNHMDMESIEALNMALEKYKGTLIFVSHDRQFVSSLATQILELDGKGGYDYYTGDYEEYLSSKGLE